MDDVEVDGVDAEALQAPLNLRLRVAAPRVELRRDKNVLASKAAVDQGTAHAALVAVGLGRSAVTVPAAILYSWTPGRDLPSRVASARAASPSSRWLRSHTDIDLGPGSRRARIDKVDTTVPLSRVSGNARRSVLFDHLQSACELLDEDLLGLDTMRPSPRRPLPHGRGVAWSTRL
jgi:hypothetical protein